MQGVTAFGAAQHPRCRARSTDQDCPDQGVHIRPWTLIGFGCQVVTARRTWWIDALIGADVSVFVDRGYQGVGGAIRR
jgi:hypothetical protein